MTAESISSTKKKWAFALAAIILSGAASVAALTAVDVYLHQKYSDMVGLNIWGYRGPSIGRKQANEWRLAMLGGSTTFGFGVHWTQSVPAYLEARLRAAGGRPITVVNLGYNNEGAHSYKFTLEDYRYLDYDAVLLYSGYNDLNANTMVFRRDSVIFRTTGYLPLLPLIASEKAMAIRYGGRLEDAYRERKTTFTPNLAQRASASALEAALHVSEALDRQFSSGVSDAQLRIEDEGASLGRECGETFAHYCGEMYLTIRASLDRGLPVIVATQPRINENHTAQESVSRPFLDRKFGTNPKVLFVDLSNLIDLSDRSLCWDGMHLTARGNQMVAEALAPHVLPLLK